MITNLKSFITVVVAGTGFIGAPVALWKTNFFLTSQPEIKTITKTLDRTKQITTGGEKCEVDKLSDNNRTFLLSKNQGGNFYIEISCIRTNEDQGAGSITTHNWTGLFPVELLARGANLSIGEKIDIKTKDASSGGSTKTTFIGKGIKGESIAGTWISQSPDTISFPENEDIKNKLYVFSY